MPPDDLARLRTVLAASERILIHDHGIGDLEDDALADLYADAVRYGLVIIRDAAQGVSDPVRRGDSRIRWPDLAGLTDRLADADAERVRGAVRAELPDLVVRLRALIAREEAR